jgi:hypothetical protein
MEILVRFRLGIGLDIEHNEEICYRVGLIDEKGREEEGLICFVGLLIKVPFLTIHIGEFMDRREMADD